MTTTTLPAPTGSRRFERVRTVGRTASAVLRRELRWRMRGKRAFVITAVAVVLMGLFVMALHQVLAVRALGDVGRNRDTVQVALDAVLSVDQLSGAASVRIGRAVFVGLLGLLTVITLVVAPALASGGIAAEREKQTLELVVIAPISTLGLVLGKLMASMAYVLIVIAASLPLMCIAFAFGGIGPDDVLEAYLLILALAFGSSALGLYLSALLGRTQLAALAAYLVLLGVMAVTLVANAWLIGSLDLNQRGFDGGGDHGAVERKEARAERKERQAERRRLGRVLLVVNPLAANLDIVCDAMPSVRGACGLAFGAGPMRVALDDSPRTTFWPATALVFGAIGIVLTLLTTQHVSTTRRARPWRRIRLRRRTLDPGP
jgi:ABC-type transport system involved in multi-copper enzyme maturation permease subunit